MAKRNNSEDQEELLRAFGYSVGNREKQEKAAKLLKNTKKPAEIRDPDNGTLLHCAVINRWTDICRQLVELYQVDPHVTDIRGDTALHYACIYNSIVIVKYLVKEAHCDPLVENNNGCTPFDKSYGESRHFLQDVIDKAKKEEPTVDEHTESVSSHGENHQAKDTPANLDFERPAAQDTATTRLPSIGESLADLSAQVSVNSPSINHPDYGLMLDFDPGSLSDDLLTPVTADIRVYADETTIQSCTYPEESKPVSAVYSISLSDTSVPVRTLRIRHCADPNNPEELEQLTFAKTTNDSSRTFEVVTGGIFKPGDHYGVITPKHMCAWTIVREKAKKMFVEKPRYIGTVLYQAIKNRSNFDWLMQLIVAKNDPKCIIALREYISNNCGSDVQADDEFYFTFQESATDSSPKMGLVPSAKLNSKDVLKCENGWKIRLDSYEVSQDTADQFRTSIDVPGKCKFKIKTCQTDSDTDPPVFSFTGIDCDRKNIQIDPPILDDSNEFETNSTDLKPEIRSSFGPTPTLDAVFGLLKPRSVKWNLIGEQLKVPRNFREELYRYDRRESEAKLEAILNEWIQREYSPVTWDNVMSVMEKMGFQIILNMIKEQLGMVPLDVDESLQDHDDDHTPGPTASKEEQLDEPHTSTPPDPTSKEQLEPQEERNPPSEQLVHVEDPLLEEEHQFPLYVVLIIPIIALVFLWAMRRKSAGP